MKTPTAPRQARRSKQEPESPAAPSPVPIREVRQGVFFTTPEALPRGRHTLDAEAVAKAQRERLLAAVTELLAATGYRGFGAGDIAKRAGVSLEAFYACFKNKDDCVFAGYDRFIKVLLTRMTSVKIAGVERVALVHNIVAAYLETLQSDLVVARAYQVEIDALGARARERRRVSLTQFAKFIEQAVMLVSPGGKAPVELNASAYLGVVYASRQLASDMLDTQAEPDLRQLMKQTESWLADLFRER